MDYLRRDAFFSRCLLRQLRPPVARGERDGGAVRGPLRPDTAAQGRVGVRELLLARLHMFLAVYYHHTATCFDHMLLRFYDSGGYDLPASRPTGTSSVTTCTCGRRCGRRRTRGRSRSCAVGPTGCSSRRTTSATTPRTSSSTTACARPASTSFACARAASCRSTSSVATRSSPLLVLEPEVGRLSRIEDYTPLYKRFSDVVGVSRVFCRPDQLEQARRIVAG